MSIFDNEETRQMRKEARIAAQEQHRLEKKRIELEAEAQQKAQERQMELEEEKAKNDHRRFMEQQREMHRLEIETARKKDQLERERQRQEKEERERGAAVFGPGGERIMGTYVGETQNEKPFGKGCLYYDNGYRYEGEFINAYYEGNGTLFNADDETIYSGSWKRGYYQGFGTLHQEDGSVYTGEFFKGAKNGHGTLVSTSGEKLEGQWVSDNFYQGEELNGKPEGRGKMIYANFDSYEGEWKHGEKNGKGVYKYHNGDQYNGFFRNDQPDGPGMMTFANHNIYEGEWVAGVRSGKGIMKYADGNTYDGQWANNKPFGEGEMHYKNRDYYSGSWDGTPNGNGTMRYANGDQFEGPWKNGKRNGLGLMTYANGDSFYGTWKDDARSGLGVSYTNGRIRKSYWEDDLENNSISSIFKHPKIDPKIRSAISKYEKRLKSAARPISDSHPNTATKPTATSKRRLIVLLAICIIGGVIFTLVHFCGNGNLGEKISEAIASGKMDQAYRLYSKNPSALSFDTQKQLTLGLMGLNQKAKALQVFETIDAYDKKKVDLAIQMITFYAQNGDLTSAAELYALSKQYPEVIKAYNEITARQKKVLSNSESVSRDSTKPTPTKAREIRWINGKQYAIIPATEWVASATLPPMGKFSYEAENLADGDLKTAWAMKRTQGQYLSLTLSDDIDLIGIYNGYVKTDAAFLNNDRVQQMDLLIDGNFITSITLEDKKECQYINIQAKQNQTLRFNLNTFYFGEKYDDVNISEIILFQKSKD